MLIQNTYKCTREDGGITYLNSKITSYEEMFYIEADSGKLITDGNTTAYNLIIPKSDIDKYYEVFEEI